MSINPQQQVALGALTTLQIGGVARHLLEASDRAAVVEALVARKGVRWEEVAMIGDDIPDLAVLRRVGLRAAVANATQPVSEIADWQATKWGGRGAAREFCDALLHARGALDKVVERYVTERSGSS